MSLPIVPGFIPGGPEMLIVGALVIVLFLGPKKIPKLARSMGEATNEWKRGRKESTERDQVEAELNADR